MTEADWLTEIDFTAHVRHIADSLSARRERLLAVGFCRTVLPFLDRFDLLEPLTIIENYADGAVSPFDMERAKQRCRDIAQESHSEYRRAIDGETGNWRPGRIRSELAWAVNDTAVVSRIPLSKVGMQAAFALKYAIAGVNGQDTPELIEPEGPAGEPARVMRGVVWEIVGNPFQPAEFSPAWRTDTALSIARHAYESRDFGALPILADALQDAGCEDEALLNHCRDTTLVHARGCWVIDHVLGNS